MRPSLRLTGVTALLASALVLPLHADEAAAGFVDFGKLAPPATGGQFVEVNVKSALIGLVVRLTEKQEPEIADLLRGLKSVRVNVIGLDDANRTELGERIAGLRTELETKGWERVVTVQEKGQDVGVYLKQRGEEAIEGIVVTVMDGKKEAVFVNIVGDIRPEKIAVLGERLNIDPLKKLGKIAGKS